MAFDITIGNATQPSTFDVVIGDAAPPDPGSVLLDFVLPVLIKGTVMLILVVRGDDTVLCSDPSWAHVINGVGASGLFLEGYVKTATGGEGGEVVSFLSVEGQELNGGLVTARNGLASSLVYDVRHAAFAADATPPAPTMDALQAEDTIVSVWSADDAIDFIRPAGSKRIIAYTSSEIAERSTLIASRPAGAVDEIVMGDATASPAATGRAWTIALSFYAPRSYAPEPTSSAVALQPTSRTLQGQLLDLVIDPVTLDFVDTDDGGWLETADSRGEVFTQIEIELGGDIYAPEDGTLIKVMLERDNPPADEELVAETRRALRIVEESGSITGASVASRRDDDGLVIDCAWTETATGSPVDFSFTPTGAI